MSTGSTGEAPKTVAILAMAEAGAAVIYGMFDLFRSAGRDWQRVIAGCEEAGTLDTLLVSADGKPVTVINGIQVVPHASFADIPVPDIVCVPEVAVDPEELHVCPCVAVSRRPLSPWPAGRPAASRPCRWTRPSTSSCARTTGSRGRART